MGGYNIMRGYLINSAKEITMVLENITTVGVRELTVVREGKTEKLSLGDTSEYLITENLYNVGDMLTTEEWSSIPNVYDEDTELANAINAASTLDELKAALLGNNTGQTSRVKGVKKD